MTKVSARWVPQELTDIHRKHRMGSAFTFLMQYKAQGNDYDRAPSDFHAFPQLKTE